MARLNCAFIRAEDANGNPVSGGKMYVYEAGTSTPVTTYSDSAMSNPQAHPLIADSAGVFATVYIAPAFYKVVITDADDVTLYEADDVLVTGEMDYRMRISFDTRAEAESSTTGQTGNDQYIWVENLIFEYSATGTALTTGDGRKWKPAGQSLPEHFGAAGDGVTDDTLPLEAWAKVATGYIELLPERHYKHNDRTRELNFENDVIVQGSHSKFDFSGWGLTGTTQDFMSRQGSYGAERNVNPAATSTSTNADGWEITKMRVVDNLTDLNPVAHGFSVNSNLKLASDDVVEDRHDAVNEKRGQQSKVAHIGGLLTLTGAVTVVAGETVTQATSGATGVVVDDGALTDNLLRVERITGTFNTSDTLTGSTSGALGANSVPTAIVIDQFEIFGVLHQALSTAPTARTVALANFQIMDLDIIGPGRRSSSTGDTGLRMLACRGFKVSRCRFFNVDYQAISIDDCLNGEVGHNEFVFPPKGDHDSFQAGVAIKNASQNIRVFDNIQDGGKHMVDLTRNETPGITRNIRIYGNMARNVWHSAFASHGNSANCEVSYNKGENCKYLVNPRTPGWKIIGNHLDHGITVVRLTDHVKDHYLQGNSGRNVTYVVHVPASEDLIGETEVGNLTILDTVGHEVSFNTVNISPTMPYLDQTDAAVTGASSTTITVAPFGTVDSVDWDQDGILKHRMISMVWNGGGASAQVREILEHTVTRDGSGNATANVLRVSGWTTDPDPALATYTVYDDTVLTGLTIRGVQSHNCAGPDVTIKGEWVDAVISDVSVQSDSDVAQACLAIFGIGGKDATRLVLDGISWRNKDAPAISATVGFEWRDDMTPEKFGCIGDGVADDTARLSEAVAYCFANDLDLVANGDYLTTASIPNFHSVKWRGRGTVRRGAKTWYIEPDDAQENIIFVAIGGDDADDGLSDAQPLATLQGAANKLAKHVASIRSGGVWGMSVGAGTFAGVDFRAALSGGVGDLQEGMHNARPIKIVGAPVGGHPNVPATVIREGATQLGYGIRADSYTNLYVQDIRVEDYNGSKSSYGIGVSHHSHLTAVNVHAEDCYIGFSGTEWAELDIQGGRINDCGYLNSDSGSGGGYGVRLLFNSKASIGVQNATDLSQGPIITNNSRGIFGQEGCVGHVDWVTFHDNDVAVRMAICSRFNLSGSSFERNGTAVWASDSGTVISVSDDTVFGIGADANGTDMLYGGGASVSTGLIRELDDSAWISTANSREERRVFTEVTGGDAYTNTSAKTIYGVRLPAERFNDNTGTHLDKKVRIRIVGELNGTDDHKRILLRFGGSLAVLTFSASETGGFQAEGSVWFGPPGQQYIYLEGWRHFSATPRSSQAAATEALTADTLLQIQAQMIDGGSDGINSGNNITIHLVEAFIG